MCIGMPGCYLHSFLCIAIPRLAIIPIYTLSVGYHFHANTQSDVHAPLAVALFSPVIVITLLVLLYSTPLPTLMPLKVTLLTLCWTPKIVTLARGLVSLKLPLPKA